MVEKRFASSNNPFEKRVGVDVAGEAFLQAGGCFLWLFGLLPCLEIVERPNANFGSSEKGEDKSKKQNFKWIEINAGKGLRTEFWR